MNDECDDFPDHTTFSQRHGYEPLPAPMRLEEISDDLRREVFNVVRLFLESNLKPSSGHFFSRGKDARFIERVLGRFERTAEYHISKNLKELIHAFECIFQEAEFNQILDILEIFSYELKPHHKNQLPTFANKIHHLFEKHAAAYRLCECQGHYRFKPRASKEQGEAIRQAIKTIHQNNMDGAATHLRQASQHINAQRYAESITDSIHAVESVARVISPASDNTLGKALKSLENAGLLKHRALKEAFEKLYGYTNDEQGIRHPLLNQDTADVELDEAIFMYGACASFAAYLSEKKRKINNP